MFPRLYLSGCLKGPFTMYLKVYCKVELPSGRCWRYINRWQANRLSHYYTGFWMKFLYKKCRLNNFHQSNIAEDEAMPPKYHLANLRYLRVNTRPCDSFNKYIQAIKDKINHHKSSYVPIEHQSGHISRHYLWFLGSPGKIIIYTRPMWLNHFELVNYFTY